MLLVVLIPRYKKRTCERNKVAVTQRKKREKKKREKERVEGYIKRFLRKRKRGRKNLIDGRLILA